MRGLLIAGLLSAMPVTAFAQTTPLPPGDMRITRVTDPIQACRLHASVLLGGPGERDGGVLVASEPLPGGEVTEGRAAVSIYWRGIGRVGEPLREVRCAADPRRSEVTSVTIDGREMLTEPFPY